MSESPGGRFETFDANERFVVVRDDEGYAVWRMEDLGEGEPLERFTDDDVGYESAAARWKELTKAERRRGGRWLGPLRVVILVSLATWVVSSAAALAISVYGGDNSFFPATRTRPDSRERSTCSAPFRSMPGSPPRSRT